MSAGPSRLEAAAQSTTTSPDHACTYCQKPTTADHGRLTLWIDGRLMIVEDVPARVCRGCGETFYEADIMVRVERLQLGSSERPEPVRKVEAPVFAWKDL